MLFLSLVSRESFKSFVFFLREQRASDHWNLARVLKIRLCVEESFSLCRGFAWFIIAASHEELLDLQLIFDDVIKAHLSFKLLEKLHWAFYMIDQTYMEL
jgi:hypothetical protein